MTQADESQHEKPEDGETPGHHLLARCAEMLAVPALICRNRACERDARCRHYYIDLDEPACLEDMTAPERAVFDALLHETIRVFEDLIAGGPLVLADAPEQRELQLAALEIALRESMACAAQQQGLRGILARVERATGPLFGETTAKRRRRGRKRGNGGDDREPIAT